MRISFLWHEPAAPEPACVTTRVQGFTLSGYAGQPTQGSVQVQQFSREERWRRALWGLGKWWGVALLSVFIPVAHFVLVPAFLLYGVWESLQRFGTTELATGARGTCPDCGREQRFEIAAQWRVPQAVTCRFCQRGLRLS